MTVSCAHTLASSCRSSLRSGSSFGPERVVDAGSTTPASIWSSHNLSPCRAGTRTPAKWSPSGAGARLDQFGRPVRHRPPRGGSRLTGPSSDLCASQRSAQRSRAGASADCATDPPRKGSWSQRACRDDVRARAEVRVPGNSVVAHRHRSRGRRSRRGRECDGAGHPRWHIVWRCWSHGRPVRRVLPRSREPDGSRLGKVRGQAARRLVISATALSASAVIGIAFLAYALAR